MTDVIDDANKPMPEKRTPEESMRLALGAAHEARLTWTAEGGKLLDAIGDALDAYWHFLERHGAIIDGRELLVAKCHGYIGWDIELMNGALDVLYPDKDGLLGSVEKWGQCEEWPRPEEEDA